MKYDSDYTRYDSLENSVKCRFLASFEVVKTCNLEGQASVVTPVSSPYLVRQLSSFCS